MQKKNTVRGKTINYPERASMHRRERVSRSFDRTCSSPFSSTKGGRINCPHELLSGDRLTIRRDQHSPDDALPSALPTGLLEQGLTGTAQRQAAARALRYRLLVLGASRYAIC